MSRPSNIASLGAMWLRGDEWFRQRCPPPSIVVAGCFFSDAEPSLPLLFGLFLRLSLSLWPFQLYFIPLILPTTVRFLTLFFRSYLCPFDRFNYLSLHESLLQP